MNKWENEKTYKGHITTTEGINAHRGISFSPEKRAEGTIKNYIDECISTYKELKKQAIKGNTESILDTEFQRFQERYLTHYKNWLYAKSNCVSTMITGGSNFPVARANKANDREHNHLTKLITFQDKAVAVITRKLRPDLAPIKTSDNDAITRLQAKIDKAQQWQDFMKKANKIIKKGVDVNAKLLAMGMNEKNVTALLNPQFEYMGKGFRRYELTNNNANISRMKKRIDRIEKLNAKSDVEITGTNGVIYKECPQENRVRLFFDGKPERDVIQHLKKSGFRWTPSLKCWQAFYNYVSIERAKEFAGVPK